MKKLLLIGIVAMLILSCNNPNKLATPEEQSTGRLILSIPDWALGVMLNGSTNGQAVLDSLKVLRNFDTELDTALLPGPIGKYTLTKKINPCCPCSAGGTSCCNCQKSMTFASPTSMNASVTVGTDTNSLMAEKHGRISLFTIPPNAGDTLTITGRGIITPLKFVFQH